ncbi:MAG TPA: DUF6209 family protein [Oligoflexus sp.]|uniref:DUF6209 family protein n=1 Tax=Oligoflexus sp. TaxID=1971216 RepID=UPI002D709A67|nr:DUF6209 family protein [Oligoflexus sp.]HYX39104.1 DUF6209 family protein [Oligoflexus sp.]
MNMKKSCLSSGYVLMCLGSGMTAIASESDRIAPTTLRFLPNAVASADGVVLSGETLILDYDPIRLSQCRGKNSRGVEEWTIQAFLSIDGKAPVALDMIEGQGTLFPSAAARQVTIPDGQRLDIWFKASDVTGCVQWDSNHSQNYTFPIYRLDHVPVLSFHDNWTTEQQGELRAGYPVRLHFDLARTPQCRTGGYHGSASWDVSAQIRVDNTPWPAPKFTYAASWSMRGQQDVVVLLPQGQELTLWFENSGYEYYAGQSCVAYDSNYGRNYRFKLN